MKIDFNSIISIIKHCLYICIFIYVNYNWPTARPNWLKLCEGTNPWVKKINEFFFLNSIYIQNSTSCKNWTAVEDSSELGFGLTTPHFA